MASFLLELRNQLSTAPSTVVSERTEVSHCSAPPLPPSLTHLTHLLLAQHLGFFFPSFPGIVRPTRKASAVRPSDRWRRRSVRTEGPDGPDPAGRVGPAWTRGLRKRLECYKVHGFQRMCPQLLLFGRVDTNVTCFL